ncbi:MAG: ribonuclease H-like domain-containing protein [Candidatus Limnocylindrales bacterium]
MTTELARQAPTMAPVTTDAGQLARRLERLRALDRRLVLAAELPPPPPRPSFADPKERAERLASGLGGRVESMPAGPVVVIERRTPLPVVLEPLRQLPYPVDPARPMVSLDTETTGLGSASGTVAFLIGVGSWQGTDFVTHQLVMADHADEPALLQALDARITPDAWLVTYNGRSFDWPLLDTRYRMYRRRAPAHAGHLDLLPIARQVWKHRLPDARLASVEAAVAGVERHEELPGAMIPDRFFGWLRSGRPELLTDVLDHNREDVVSLGRLLGVLAEVLADPVRRRAEHPGDIAGLARAYERSGRTAEALACYGEALGAWDVDDRQPSRLEWADVAADGARLLSKLHRHEDAEAAWLDVAARGGGSAVWAWIAVAKIREHKRRDVHGALEAAELARAIVERRRAVGVPLRAAERDLSRRLRRLRRRAQPSQPPSTVDRSGRMPEGVASGA